MLKQQKRASSASSVLDASQLIPAHLLFTGKDEGAFAWLTLNYLLGHLGKEPEATTSAIDLVGAVQRPA